MEDIGKNFVKAISPVYHEDFEREIFKNLISALYLQSFTETEAEKILISVYTNLPSHSIAREDVFKMYDGIYISNETKPTTGITNLKNYLVKNCDKTLALRVVRKINSVLIPSLSSINELKLSLGSEKYIVMDNKLSEVYYESISTAKDGNLIPIQTRVLLCYPHKIIEHNNPISDAGRSFSITWRTKSHKFFTTNNMTQSEIETELYERGYVLSKKLLNTTITAIFHIAENNDILISKNEIENRGFYYDDKQQSLIKVGYELNPLDKSEILESLLLIEDLKHFFIGVEDKLATTLKHGLIAPFGFAKKQMGLPLEYLIPYIYHYGKAGSGKTTIARIGLWFYDPPNMNMNDIGGTEFDTVPRIGEQLEKFTFGLLVNEPETSLSKRSCASTLKTSMERTNARQKFKGNHMEHILALAMVSFASNIPLPNIEGLPRRFVQILYSHNEKKTTAEKEAFMSHFKLNNPMDCEFNKLQYLANFAVATIDDNINLLKLDWKELGNELIKQAYSYCEREVPKWLLQYTESVTDEDIEIDEIEDIRMFFINEINKQSGQIKVYNPDDERMWSKEHFNSDIPRGSDDIDLYNRIFNVINNGLLPYASLRMVKGTNNVEVCFTNGLKTVLLEKNIQCYNLGSTAELLGWKYKQVKLNKKNTRCVVVGIDEFVNFLYPQLEENDEN